MAEFRISRIRYRWRGTWQTGIDYLRDDVIYYRGKSWVCVRQHTSSDFAADVTFRFTGDTETSPAWLLMAEGYEWRGDWESGTLYEPGNLALFGGTIFLCVYSHTSSDFASDSVYWVVYSQSDRFKKNWSAGVTYGPSDIVKYSGYVYRCRIAHTAGATLELDQNKWEIVYEGVQYRGSWTPEVYYVKNDLVKYGATIFRCSTPHTSETEFADANFQVEFFGNEFGGTWSSSLPYKKGSIVRHGGYLYLALTNNVGSIPGDAETADGSTDWAVLSKGQDFKGEWSPENSYKTGDVVNRGGMLYIARQDSQGDGSTLDYLDAGYWEVVVPGDEWKNFWQENTLYFVGEVVLYDGSSYRCNFSHVSTNENFPGDNGNGIFYWDVIIQANENTGLSQPGDLLTFGLSRKLSGDQSTLSVTEIPIGEPGKLLEISENDSFQYKQWGDSARFFYVTKDGVDDAGDPERGINPFKPWNTIEYACKRADDEYAGLTTIYVGPGVYEEITPIIVPKQTAIRGTELRTTTVRPVQPLEINNTVFINRQTSSLNRITGLLSGLFVSGNVTKLANNPLDPVFVTEKVEQLDQEGNTVLVDAPVLSDSTTVDIVLGLASQILQFLNFYIAGEGTDVAVTGSNTLTTTTAKLNAARILEANREFLAAEALALLQADFSADTDEVTVKNIYRRYINAWIYDIKYSGNYETILAATYQRNRVLGATTQDMFRVRDTSGIRNLSLEGIRGSLNPTGVFELFQRPTGGAYVSLDPGWGPDDERVWIKNRSCYVQNVSTFGYAAVGQKIDGALHNGGNRSIVSNDFTQVISDGIGAWVLNNGRAELVSVFTYYAQVGYLAEDGGIIRATNGNCSYGNFGAYATGVDQDEVYKTAFIDNRNQDAIVDKAFAGEVNDEILALEYINAGIGYTQAQADFIGAGINAVTEFDDFRDNAVFRYEITNPLDSGSPGGGGYTQRGNNAQTGNELTITIASSDESLESELLGLRIIITSGTGTGQYGYVQAYNDITKVVTVYRESDDRPGWDHLVSGTPAVPLMNTSTTYRFEPRPIVDDPGFSSSDITLGANTNWSATVYGETTEAFSDVAAALGTGSVITQDGLVPESATFDVVKTGRDYSVGLSSAGAGYSENDEVKISGEDLGGISPDNDITITVTEVSDDSTNSIVNFVSEGQGSTGKFVVTAALGNTVTYSSDGDNWETSALPSNGNWKCLAAGQNRFVAVEGRDIGGNASRQAAYSLDGVNWTASTMPSAENWNDLVFGDGLFVAVAGSTNAGAFSKDGGETWASTTLPSAPDSTLNEWSSITYGKGQFVAVANSNNLAATGTYDSLTNTISWELHIMDVIADSTQKDWNSVEWGNNRYVAMSSQGDVAYSFDGSLWLPAQMPSEDGSTLMTWTAMSYDNGIFFAVCNTGGREIGGDETEGPTKYMATSSDGIVWTDRFLQSAGNWSAVAYGRPDITVGDSSIQNNTPTWIVISNDQQSLAQKVFTGARSIVRAELLTRRIVQVNIIDPGSGYRSTPNVEVIDPNNTSDVFITPRIGDGVLAQPSWISRGLGFRTSSTTVEITGDGVADVIPILTDLTLDGLDQIPGPGTQLLIDGLSEPRTVVLVTPLDPNPNGTLRAQITVDPTFTTEINPEHLAGIRIRERYSQCRISGHDFLDIGTGNFVETNYPDIYANANFFTAAPENEVTETDGGRVFYTSTDQDGNFRAGELFAVEQATGVVTISAQFFDLDGLSELKLGGIRVGGSGVVIREFSTDPLFTEDSNNVVPTQRAIAAYLQNQLSVGGSELTLNNFVAGTTSIGPTSIGSSVGLYTRFPEPLNFQANPEELDDEGNIIENQGEVQGTILAQTLFHSSFADDPTRQS